MDIDSIVSVLILFCFFVLPIILKRIGETKKRSEKKEDIWSVLASGELKNRAPAAPVPEPQAVPSPEPRITVPASSSDMMPQKARPIVQEPEKACAVLSLGLNSRQGLRHAVILSEILAAPLALREKKTQ